MIISMMLVGDRPESASSCASFIGSCVMARKYPSTTAPIRITVMIAIVSTVLARALTSGPGEVRPSLEAHYTEMYLSSVGWDGADPVRRAVIVPDPNASWRDS